MDNKLKNVGIKLTEWYSGNKRDLPWRQTKDPYKIWISEVMLQQTRVDTVTGYFNEFTRRFPDVFKLAAADEQSVLSAWKGLGYYSRARNLHRAAKEIVARYGGRFPDKYEEVRALPGIGSYTAGAVLSIAFNQPHPAVDGNALRVVSRIGQIEGDIALDSTKKMISKLVEEMIPEGRAKDFSQALMELGALVCVPAKPMCGKCPIANGCGAYLSGKQDILPVKRKKNRGENQVSYWVAVVREGGKILMEHRKGETLLGQMWGLPMVEHSPDFSEERLFAGKYGLSLKKREWLGTVRHVFSHRTWKMNTAVYSLREKPDLPPTLHWVREGDMDDLAVPTAFRKVLRLLGQKESYEQVSLDSFSEDYGWMTAESRERYEPDK
ncbi:MAG: A/G-specific adenine glycosylase [Clostridiales bacterium]|nr:A/G-specific adenine glycosylase [Eubacteriales bacterium]MDH7565695.1 A/G-specific adenine glycosylase [Clostridiales bacterium]